MKSRIIFLVFAIITIAAYSCKKAYNPPTIASANSYLVIEGLVNSGPDSTILKLSRTVNISSKITANPELHAVITVEGEKNGSYTLQELGNGKYDYVGLNLDNSQRYRVRIKTNNNSEYLSDFSTVIVSPPLDSVSYKIQSDGLALFSNTHDAATNSRYYRWEYQETWIIHAKYYSYYKSNGDTVLARDLVNDNIYMCWQSNASSTIILNSSAKLAQNVISQNPLTFIPSTSERLGTEYSILVRQYALSPDAYNFYQNIKTVTEQLGSIFDAEPSQVKGNIHCVTNPNEPVIGYLSIGQTSEKRIFIHNKDLPAWLPILPYADCVEANYLYVFFPVGSKTPENQVNEFINFNKGATIDPQIPISAIAPPGGSTIGYTASSPACTDCTLRGTNKQPAFWVN